jgi:methylglutaconyl-CoA hydratase
MANENPISEPLVPGHETELDGPVILDASRAGVAYVTINRPQKKNAFDVATVDALRQAFETLHGADHVRVVFLRGAGGSFCAGADLEWMRDAVDWTESQNRDDAMGVARMLKALHDIPALTVALVEGSAFGGGAGLVAACDTALAAEDAIFAFSEVKLGLIPATISPYVVQAVGPRIAKLLFATGRRFDAAYALGAGLVHTVLPADRLMNAAEAIANEMTSSGPEAVAASKALVDAVAHREIDRRLMEDTARRLAAARVGQEGQEGVRAFLEKRRPGWAG